MLIKVIPDGNLDIRVCLIKKIRSSDNKILLQEIYRLFELESKNEHPFVVNEKQRSVITAARKDIHDGRLLHDEEANEQLEQCRKDKLMANAPPCQTT